MSAPKMKRPPAAGTAEGASYPMGETVSHPYAGADGTDKQKPESVERIMFRSVVGRTWRYRGKRARVLTLVTSAPDGLTQWDTLPWHTRFVGTIHVLREDGLAIETACKGDCRHARYRLLTAGCLVSGGGQ